MEDLTAEIPSNEKSCQTDEMNEIAPVLRPACFVEPGDPPLLQRPLQTSKSGIQQIIECLRTGTPQLKHMILKEVDLIFECKLCQSLFRGLPNLITHKEFYCFPTLPETEELSGTCRQSIAIKELLEVIYPRSKEEETVVRLEPIPGNQNAVFQHLANLSDVDLQPTCQNSNHVMEDGEHKQPESQGRDNDAGGESENEEANDVDGKAHAEKDAHGDEVEEKQENAGEEKVPGGAADEVIISCSLCGKDFGSRRSLRRHCREVHKQRLEELRKFTETRTVPISLLSVVKERQAHSPQPHGKRCQVCFKTFATRANVRRHFDEVHRGRQRDVITLDVANKSSDLEVTPAVPCPPQSPNPNPASPVPQCSLASCKCLLCKRSYSTQTRLKRHMRLVHKIHACQSAASSSSVDKKPQSGEGAATKETHEHLKRLREDDRNENSPVVRKPKLSVGFDFKQLFCKLCKRQFSSRQNFTKHVELHTDNGGDIFIKFYRCPLCRYESRRKRDVLRHISVVHKKNSTYLAKIQQGLESRAVKKSAETVLGTSVQRSNPKDPGGHNKADTGSSPGPREARPPSPVNHKPDVRTPSPPVTRRQSLSLHASSVTCSQNSNGTASGEETQDSTEVRVTKNFSLHACDVCGRAFAKKFYLESHKRSHRSAAKPGGRTVGVSTRSKSLLW